MIDSNGFPRFGVIVIDAIDLANMLIKDQLIDVITHEIGHVLGLGTLWREGETFENYIYLKPKANAMDVILRNVNSGAVVEDEGGMGTAGSHWKEAVYGDEIMTGYIETSRVMPLSILSIGALEDLGYSVNYDMGEEFYPSVSEKKKKEEEKEKLFFSN